LDQRGAGNRSPPEVRAQGRQRAWGADGQNGSASMVGEMKAVICWHDGACKPVMFTGELRNRKPRTEARKIPNVDVGTRGGANGRGKPLAQ